MSILKCISTTTATAVFAAALALSSPTAFAADAAAPDKAAAPAAAATAADPAAADTAAPATDAAPDADNAAAAPADAAPADDKAPAADPKKMSAPASAPAPAIVTEAPAPAGALKAADLTLGATVVGSDGKPVGTINRVRSEASGAVTEIHVATSGANVIAVPGDKITSGGKSVKLSLTSDEAGKLPMVGGKEG